MTERCGENPQEVREEAEREGFASEMGEEGTGQDQTVALHFKPMSAIRGWDYMHAPLIKIKITEDLSKGRERKCMLHCPRQLKNAILVRASQEPCRAIKPSFCFPCHGVVVRIKRD